MNRRDLVVLHTDKSLLFKLRLFLVISLVLLGIIIYDLILQEINLPLAAIGIGIGIAVGLVAGRMFKIHWHEEKKKIASRIDMWGIVIIVLYIGFELLRERLFSNWVNGSVLTAFTFAFFSGTMFGRFITMGFGIRSILYSRGLFK